MTARRVSGRVRCVVAGLLVLACVGPALALVHDHLRPATTVTGPGVDQARADAAAAVADLRVRDLDSLGQHLARHTADPVFASYFARSVTPRELGDGIAVLDTGHATHLAAGGGTDREAYERLLDQLAGTLSLATHGTAGLALPASWTSDFVLSTTTPGLLYVDAERAEQDRANKQNLLQLLARGSWSTEFLQQVTSAYWDWEHHPDAEDAGPWPAITGGGPDLAKVPGAALLTDGMVALTAALTRNPEAAGWAFTDFQPGTEELEGTDQEIGIFAHHLFFVHQYAESTDLGDGGAGVGAAVTALHAAIRATGGSHSAGAVGPQADLYALQELEKMAKEDEAEERERESRNVFENAAYQVTHPRELLDAAHGLLDLLGLVPVVGAPADGASAAWSVIEGDWESAGLSLVGIVPVVGEAVGVARSGYRLYRAGRAFRDDLKAGVRLTTALRKRSKVTREFVGEAYELGKEHFQFEDPATFLAAVANPEPGRTYVCDETVYATTASGSLTHLAGPGKEVIERELGGEVSAVGSDDVSERSRTTLHDLEESGLCSYRDRTGVTPKTTQALFHVDGVLSGRYYDGLVRLGDGTFRAIEVVQDGDALPLSQIAFDDRVGPDRPATATIDGVTVEVTSVEVEWV